MTLVVAYASTASFDIVCDTRLKFNDLGRPLQRENENPIRGSLKTLLLSSSIGFAFAGGREVAIDALRKIRVSKNLEDYESIKCILMESHISSKHNTDFLLFSTNPTIKIAKICNGNISEGEGAQWIGSEPAWNAFRGFLQRYSSYQTDVKEYWRNNIAQAMKDLIESGRQEDVGGFLVQAGLRDGSLRYISWATIEIRPAGAMNEIGFVNSRLMNTEEGGFSVSMLTPVECGIPAIAFYFYSQKKGLFYYPVLIDDPEVIDNAEPSTFIELILNKYKITLQGNMRWGSMEDVDISRLMNYTSPPPKEKT